MGVALYLTIWNTLLLYRKSGNNHHSNKTILIFCELDYDDALLTGLSCCYRFVSSSLTFKLDYILIVDCYVMSCKTHMHYGLPINTWVKFTTPHIFSNTIVTFLHYHMKHFIVGYFRWISYNFLIARFLKSRFYKSLIQSKTIWTVDYASLW